MSMQETIERKLSACFPIHYLEVLNESSRHNVPPASETHFKVTIVSEAFRGKPLVARHRLVFDALAEEMRSGIHALALHTFTEADWGERAGTAPTSPPCLGGESGRA